MTRTRSSRATLLLTALLAVSPAQARAQDGPSIVRDGTIGPDAGVQPLPETSATGEVRIVIGEELGARPGGGDTLLHSFERFHLGVAETGLFTADPGRSTANIIARVTGGERSELFGTLASDVPGADLYFLNPAGIFFGPSARLDVQGSFLASTASEVRFPNGARLGTGAGGAVPLLSLPAPSEFRFGASPAPIAIDGAQLRVEQGSLSLIGGDIDIRGPEILLDEPGNPSPLSFAFDIDELLALRPDLAGQDPVLLAQRLFTGDLAIDPVFFSQIARINGGLFGRPLATLAAPAGRITLLAAGPDGSALRTGLAQSFEPIGSRGDIRTSRNVVFRGATSGYGVDLFGRDLDLDSFRLLNDGPFVAGEDATSVRLDATGRIDLSGTVRSVSPEIIVTPTRRLTLEEILMSRNFSPIATLGSTGPITPSDAVRAIQIEQVQGRASEIRTPGTLRLSGSQIVLGEDLRSSVEQGVTLASGSRIELSGGSLDGLRIVLTAPTLTSSLDSLRLAGSTISADVLDLRAGSLGIKQSWISVGGNAGVIPAPSRISGSRELRLADTMVRGGIAFQGGNVEIVRSSLAPQDLRLPDGSFAGSLGSFEIRGDTIAMVDSKLVSTTPLAIHADRSIQLSRTSNLGDAPSISAPGISIDARDVRIDDYDLLPSGSGATFLGADGGDIAITGGRLELRGGLLDATGGLSLTPSAGSIRLNASESVMLGISKLTGLGPSLLATSVGAAPGQESRGMVTIRAPEVRIDGAFLAAAGFDATPLIVAGQRLASMFPFVRPLLQLSPALAGVIDVEAQRIDIRNGAILDSSGFGASTGGQVRLSASQSIAITGVDTRIRARTTSNGSGGISLESPLISILDGASVTTEAAPLLASDPVVPAIVTFASNSLPEVGFFPIQLSATARAGDIRIDTDRLLLGQAELRSSSARSGAGSVSINARRSVDLVGGSITTFAAQGPSSETTAARGNISISAGQRLSITQQSVVTSSVGEGRGGDVRLSTPGIAFVLGGSQILAETASGDGGQVRIDAGIFRQDASSRISADAGVGNSGTVEINSPEVDLASGPSTLVTQFANTASLLRPSCAAESEPNGKLSVLGRRGLPASPEEMLLAFEGLQQLDPLPPVAAADAPALTASAEGQAAFRGGQFAVSESRFADAAREYAATGDTLRSASALHDQARAQLALGEFARSVATLAQALDRAERSGDRALVAAALGSLGDTQLALGQSDEARGLMERGLALARQVKANALAAAIQNNLGNHYLSRSEYAAALAAYSDAAELASGAQARVSEAKALANGARAALESGEPDRAKALLAQARTRVAELPSSRERTILLIHLGTTYTRLAPAAGAGGKQLRLDAHALLDAAAAAARESAEPRTLSYALGALGALYRSDGRLAEALYLTRRALQQAEEASAADSAYRWHWQEGQILWRQGKSNAAIAAYRRAVDILEETRQESRARYGSSRTYFEHAIAPVYLDLADALLQATDLLEDDSKSARDALLLEARATVERLKVAELRNYFRDECLVDLEARSRSLDDLSRQQKAAVVYPIPLRDRTELLVSLPSGLARFSVGVGSEELGRVARAFSYESQRQGKVAFKAPSQQLYRWLVAPYAADLEREAVKTLVFVPAPELRSVPLAALHDGSGFLIERYGVAVAPGLSLVDPRPLDRAGAKILLAGVSESVQQMPPLAAVEGELEAVRKTFGGAGEILLNDAFTSERLDRELLRLHPTIVHVASHSVFTGDPETSFLLTHGDRVSMSHLSTIVGRTRYRTDAPVELLTLSGCRTAAGDDRAALGLAGVAVRSGARSAVGSLWQVGDSPASQLMVAFYGALRDGGVSKAEALRRAQLEMIRSEPYAHPFFWSPFLLIGNWL